MFPPDWTSSTLDRIKQIGTEAATKCRRRRFTVRHTKTLQEPSFALFLALPIEIRERIYESCCDNDRSILEEHFISAKVPPEPAIACASRQLRKEALPVFYRHYRFPVTFTSSALINKGYLPPSQEWRAARWYHRLDPAKLRMVRKLELYYCFGRFQVDLDMRCNTYTVEQTGLGCQRMVDTDPGEEAIRLLALVRSVLDELTIGSLSALDLDRLELEVGSVRSILKKSSNPDGSSSSRHVHFTT